MTAAASLAFPGTRKLAGWWRQLAPYRPQALWVGYLLLHHVEALVRLSHARRLDSFTHFLLKALALNGPAPPAASSAETLQRLDAHLHLGRQVLAQALRGLAAEGLAEAGPAGYWTLTTLGRQALERQEYPQVRHERRTFHFIDYRGETGRSSPHFLNLHNSTGIPWPAAEGVEFDVGTLQACLSQSPEWKQKHGFPLEVQEILSIELEAPESVTPSSSPPSWQRVIVDRPEHILAVLLLVPSGTGEQQLVGIAVRQDGWVLQAAEPLFTLGADWRDVFPELAREPSLEVWRQAWRAWCEPRSLPAGEANACALERHGERLRVIVPHRLIERLRATRSDALKGETWLLAGEGRIRPAALVELVEG
jgi:hypothetical protein